MRECRLFYYHGGHRGKKGENKDISIFLPFFLCALCVKKIALKNSLLNNPPILHLNHPLRLSCKLRIVSYDKHSLFEFYCKLF